MEHWVTDACFGMSVGTFPDAERAGVGAFPDAERAGLASAPLAERYFTELPRFECENLLFLTIAKNCRFFILS